MSSNSFVFNQSRGYHMRHKQAARAVENCACTWVEFGVSVRDLTLVEAIAARNHQAAMRDPLPFAELPGLLYRPAAGKEVDLHRLRGLTREANAFAQSH